jgi:thioesterase domain-containing protein
MTFGAVHIFVILSPAQPRLVFIGAQAPGWNCYQLAPKWQARIQKNIEAASLAHERHLIFHAARCTRPIKPRCGS